MKLISKACLRFTMYDVITDVITLINRHIVLCLHNISTGIVRVALFNPNAAAIEKV